MIHIIYLIKSNIKNYFIYYLVGDLVKKPMDGVYGTKTSVSEDLLIKILEKWY